MAVESDFNFRLCLLAVLRVGIKYKMPLEFDLQINEA